MDSSELINTFGEFFAIMNPFVNLPLFLTLTAGLTIAQQRTLAIKITVHSAIMCAIILFAGQKIIGFFGSTIDQLRIAGGVVLADIAWSMLNGNPITSHHGTGAEKHHMEDLSGLAFYPITFPIIVGPGTIATLIIYAGKAKGVEALISIGSVVGVVIAMLFFVLFCVLFWQSLKRRDEGDHDAAYGHDPVGHFCRDDCIWCNGRSAPAWLN